jgi:hypothetical protein
MKSTVILWVIFLISSACSGKGEQHTYSNMTIHQIEFSEITFTLDKKTRDTIQTEGVLKNETMIDSLPCEGKVTFSKDWKLKEFTLAKDHEFGSHTFPKGTCVGLNIDVQEDIGSMSMYLAVRDVLNRLVNTCKFMSNQPIDGLLCNGEQEVYFTTQWKLLVCILAEEDTVAGNLMQKSTLIRYNNDGTIWCFCLYNPEIQGVICSGTDYTGFWMGGGGISLYPSGRLKYFQPVNDIEIQGVTCKPSSVRGGIYLFEDGKLKKCTSAKDQIIDGVFIGKNFTLKFDEDGKIIYSKKEKIFQ